MNQHLSSWLDTPTKQAILEFVTAVTTENGPHYVPPVERIATFNNDGTLWCEHPVPVQMIRRSGLGQRLGDERMFFNLNLAVKAFIRRYDDKSEFNIKETKKNERHFPGRIQTNCGNPTLTQPAYGGG